MRHRGFAPSPRVMTTSMWKDWAWAPSVGAAGLGGGILGVATAYGQFWLPERIGSLANSSGAWCAAAFGLALLAPRLRTAAAAGAVTLLALLAGYMVGAGIRGDVTSRSLLIFWGLAALLAGPVLGAAAYLLRRGSAYRAAAGAGVISGVLVGEGTYGLVVISETTSPAYWWAQIAVGTGVLFFVAARRLRRPGPIAVAAGTTALIAVAFACVYALDLIVLLS